MPLSNQEDPNNPQQKPQSQKQVLWKYLAERGLISRTYEQFEEAWAEPGFDVRLHKSLRKKKIYSKDFESFLRQFGDIDTSPGKSSPENLKGTDSSGETDSSELEYQKEAELHRALMPDTSVDDKLQKVRNKAAEARKVKYTPLTNEKHEAFGRALGVSAEKGDFEKVVENDRALENMQEYLDNIIKEAPEIQKNFEAIKEDQKTVTDKVLGPVVDVIEGQVDYFENLKDKEDPTVIDRFNRFLVNMPKQLELSWDQIDVYGAELMDRMVSDRVSDWMLTPFGGEDKGPIVKDSKGNYYYEKTAEPVGKVLDEYTVKKFKEIKEEGEKIVAAGSITGGFKNKDFGEFLGGIFDAAGGMATSVGPAMLTGGASIIPQIVAPMYVDYNITKAEEMYGDTDDPLKTLVDKGETEFWTPTVLGIAAAGLEFVGFKGITKAIARMPKGKVFAEMLISQNKEGLTEVGQFGIQTFNTELAKGKSEKEAGLIAITSLGTIEAAENYLQGFAGSGVVTGPAAIHQSLARSLRGDGESQRAVEQSLSKIAHLKVQRGKIADKDIRRVIDKQIKAESSTLREFIKENYRAVKHLSPEQRKELKQNLKRQDEIIEDLKTLDKQYKKGKITSQQKATNTRSLNTESLRLAEQVKEIKKNIDYDKIYKDIELGKKLEKVLPGLKVNSFEHGNGVIDFLKTATKEDGSKFTEEEINRFSEQYGFIFKDSEGNQNVVINVDAAFKDGMATTGQHEVLHKVLNNVLVADPNLATKLGKDIVSAMKEKFTPEQLKNSEWGRRMGAYHLDYNDKINDIKSLTEEKIGKIDAWEKQGELTPEQAQEYRDKVNKDRDELIQRFKNNAHEERLTTLSEAITNGDLELNEDTSSFLKNVGELLRRTFSSLGITKTKLSTPEQVFNFIKDYSRGYQKGKLDASIIRLAKENKVDISDVVSTVKESKADKKDLYSRTEAIYKEHDVNTAAFLIGEEWKNEIKRRIKNQPWRDNPGFNTNYEDLVTNSAYVGSQSVGGLVKSFSPKKGVPLSAYINVSINNKILYNAQELGIVGRGKKWTLEEIKKELPEASEEELQIILEERNKSFVSNSLGFTTQIDEGRTEDEEGNEMSDDFGIIDETSLEDQETRAEQERRKRPTLKQSFNFGESDGDKAFQEALEKSLKINISAAAKFHSIQTGPNQTVTTFYKELTRELREDLVESAKDWIGRDAADIEAFLIKNRVAMLENFTTTYLSKHPVFRKVIEKKIVNGGWESPTLVKKNKYDWVDEKGNKKKIARDNASLRGLTSGPELIRRAENPGAILSEQEYVDYHFTDPGHKYKAQNPYDALARQVAQELSLEVFSEDIQKGGELISLLKDRKELYDQVVAENFEQEELKNIERGTIKLSHVNKTGKAWFDRPRIAMTNYLASIKSNELREKIVNGEIKDPEFDELHDRLVQAYSDYNNELAYKDQWKQSEQAYATAFEDKGFKSFNDFMAHTMGQVNKSVEGYLGLEPGATSFGKGNIGRVNAAKKEGVQMYIRDLMSPAFTSPYKEETFVDIIKTLVGATSGSVGGALYVNTPGFYEEVVQPAINEYSLKGFKLVEVDGGTTITYEGKKITTDYSKAQYSPDTIDMFSDIALENGYVENKVNVEGRKAEAKKSGELFLDYLTWLKDNKENINPETIGMMVKGFGSRGRSVMSIMHPLSHVMLSSENLNVEDYAEVKSIPSSYTTLAALGYVTGKLTKAQMQNIINEGSTLIVPKAQAKVIDQMYYDSFAPGYEPGKKLDPINYRVNTEKVNNKLWELNLPKIDLTQIEGAGAIPVIDLEAQRNNIKFSKGFDLIKNAATSHKGSKGISIWDFDDTLAHTDAIIRVPGPNQQMYYVSKGKEMLYPMNAEYKLHPGGEWQDTSQFKTYADILVVDTKLTKANHGVGPVTAITINPKNIVDAETARQALIERKAEGQRKKNLNSTILNRLDLEKVDMSEVLTPPFPRTKEDYPRKRIYDFLTKKGIKAVKIGDEIFITDSSVLEKPEIKLTPQQFAEMGDIYAMEGKNMDFSDFVNIENGKPGPMFDKAVKRNEKFGNEHVFVLTARPEASTVAIHQFLKGIGLDIKIENITGLADGSPQAKADWVISKAAEGYNDIYFADDSFKNVEAVQDVLNEIDVKSDVVQAKIKYSLKMNQEFHSMLEQSKGVKSTKRFSAKEAGQKGREKTEFWLLIPPSAEDFVGLLYRFMGKGKEGDAHHKWLDDKLIRPYKRGINRLDIMRTEVVKAYHDVMRKNRKAVKRINKQVPGIEYKATWDLAVRVFNYNRAGYQDQLLEDMDAAEIAVLVKEVATDKEMLAFANALSAATKHKNGYPPPEQKKNVKGYTWLDESIPGNFSDLITTEFRKKALAEFIENTEVIFDDVTRNKIQAIYGTKFLKAFDGAIKRMISGTSRNFENSEVVNEGLDWVNASVGSIMFLNQRSALLQMVSMANYTNWTDNHPGKIFHAIGKNPAGWVKTAWGIFFSPKLKQRRSQMRFSVEEAELAQMKGSRSYAKQFYNKMWRIGYAPTQWADSFAISMGGASFLINRTATYEKSGMSSEKAADKAWEDFSMVTDESQQSSDQMLLSEQQTTNTIGRLVLAFANTPIQYTRLTKKAILDLKNGRGDFKTNISKIMYYAAIQNIMFSAVQAAFWTIPFFDDENEEEADLWMEGKYYRILNSSTDTILRGLGAAGAVLAAIKNALVEAKRQSEKDYTQDPGLKVAMQAFSMSPPLSSKIRDFYKIYTIDKYEKDVIDSIGGRWDSPIYRKYGLGLRAVANIPMMDWYAKKAEIAKAISDTINSDAQKVAMAAGYSPYEVEAVITEFEEIKAAGKEKRKEDGQRKAAITREKNKEIERIRRSKLTKAQRKEEDRIEKEKRQASAKKAQNTKRENKRRAEADKSNKIREKIRSGN